MKNFIVKWFLKYAVDYWSKTQKGGLMLEKIKAALTGKKSYLVIVLMIATAGIDAILKNNFGVTVPADVWAILFGLLGITWKAGQNRIENATKELIDAVKEQNKLLK